MINLLPDDHKAEIRAGRINVIVLNYIIMVLIALGFLAVVVAGTFVTLNISHSNAESRVARDTQSVTAYASVSQEADAFRSDLSTAKTILGNQVTYSKLIIKIGQAVPAGVVIDSLDLDAKTLGTPTTMTAHVKSKAAAESLKSSFQSRTDLFSDVHFEQIDLSGTSSNPSYPITVTLGLTINKAALNG